MKQYIRYKKTNLHVNVDYLIRNKICECCGKHTKTDLHHWKYAYPTKQVQKYKLLALDNTVELCWSCHRLANCISHLDNDDQEKVNKLIKLRDKLRNKNVSQ
jgi:hypothetical protein